MGIRDKKGQDMLASWTKAIFVFLTSDGDISEYWIKKVPICRVLELWLWKALGSVSKFSCSGPLRVRVLTLWFDSHWLPTDFFKLVPSTLLTYCYSLCARNSEEAAQEIAVGFKLDCIPKLAGGFIKCTLEQFTLRISNSREVWVGSESVYS